MSSAFAWWPFMLSLLLTWKLWLIWWQERIFFDPVKPHQCLPGASPQCSCTGAKPSKAMDHFTDSDHFSQLSPKTHPCRLWSLFCFVAKRSHHYSNRICTSVVTSLSCQGVDFDFLQLSFGLYWVWLWSSVVYFSTNSLSKRVNSSGTHASATSASFVWLSQSSVSF